MAGLNPVVRFLNKEINLKSIPDDSRNGLQVRACKDVKRVGFAVDGCMSTFEKAKKKKIDLLVVHHGILWKGHKDENGLRAKKIKFLKKNKISLYGCHLPLDKNPKFGNNIILCDMLGLKKIKEFGRYHGKSVGFRGVFDKTKTLGQIKSILDKKLKTKCKILNYGTKKIKKVGIVSGRGQSILNDAYKSKVDCFITGEIVHEGYLDARDLGMNIITGGHYQTETVGVKALMPLLKEKFNIETVFIDNPAGE